MFRKRIKMATHEGVLKKEGRKLYERVWVILPEITENRQELEKAFDEFIVCGDANLLLTELSVISSSIARSIILAMYTSYSEVLNKYGNDTLLHEWFSRVANLQEELDKYIWSQHTLNLSKGFFGITSEVAKITHINDFIGILNKKEHDMVELSSITEEMTSSVADVSDSVLQVLKRTNTATERTQEGHEVILKALDEVGKASKTFTVIQQTFNELEKAVQSIQKMTDVIKNIADRTNLLSLNARIEGVKVGEQGKGFMVVAGDIKKLSETTVLSLEDVKDNTDKLANLAQRTKTIIKDSVYQIDSSIDRAKHAADVLQEIMTNAHDIQSSMEGISTIAEEQNIAIDEFGKRVLRMTDDIQSLKQEGEKTGNSVNVLSKTINSLRLSTFSNIPHTPEKTLIYLAISDHLIWMWRVYNLMLGFETIEMSEVTSHKVCRLGKWYYTPETLEKYKNNPTFNGIEEYHALLHRTAKEAVEVHQQGNEKLLREKFEILQNCSKHIVNSLEKLAQQ
ncbi:methyl-accepting chemotaxis protein [Bacillus luti]|nr:CZB domain-containing protein [Bacillus cereus]HDR8338109.1 CZB domain-containing protein [Bacillus cereus]